MLMFLVCGEALFDFFLGSEDGPGALGFDARAGGSPFNVAIGMARLGGASGLFTALSDDLLGTRLRKVLADEGVRDDYLLDTSRLTTVSLVGLNPEGHPAYAFHSKSTADTGVTPADVPTLGSDVTGLHFGSYSIAVPPVADAMAQLAANAGDRLVSLDPNIRPSVEPDMDVWKERVQAFFPAVDVVKISAEDLEVLHPGVSHEAFATDALGAGAKLVVVTDGGDAAQGWTASGLTARVTPPSVKVIDTVGAGDTFQASLLFQLMRNGNGHAAIANMTVDGLTEMLQFCAGAAAVTCSRRGADLPRLSELTHLPGA
jgi:fructokinase